MFVAQINAPDGRNTKYRKAHKALIEKHRFDRVSSSDHCRLLKCLRNRNRNRKLASDAANEQAPETERTRWLYAQLGSVHPPGNWTRRSREEAFEIEELRKINVELREENDRLRASEGGTLTSKDTARDVVRPLRGLYSESKLADMNVRPGDAPETPRLPRRRTRPERLREDLRRAEAEIERLRDAKRRALAIADERSKENVELRREIEQLWAAFEARSALAMRSCATRSAQSDTALKCNMKR